MNNNTPWLGCIRYVWNLRLLPAICFKNPNSMTHWNILSVFIALTILQDCNINQHGQSNEIKCPLFACVCVLSRRVKFIVFNWLQRLESAGRRQMHHNCHWTKGNSWWIHHVHRYHGLRWMWLVILTLHGNWHIIQTTPITHNSITSSITHRRLGKVPAKDHIKGAMRPIYAEASQYPR